ncbi:NlpC/P60 family protein [Streptomyces sp. NBC_01381]|uniref:NlpC/P60 family protein n=1 Tax=Streptomyces sp. NBC_01381 TaxID=2903845 RepID=UPI002B1D7E2B|nr:NlpC/P60 family protein [Streptomyces sp. NBC_01381]
MPPTAKSLRPGDLVFTKGSAARPEHVAMVIGGGLVVPAPRPGRVVEVAEVATHGNILVVRALSSPFTSWSSRSAPVSRAECLAASHCP